MAMMFAPPSSDDNFAFIDRLLDTLQSEQGPQANSEAESPREPHSDDLNVQSAWDAVGACELCEAVGSQPRAAVAAAVAAAPHSGAPTGPNGHTMSELLSRFCEDGDESIVDELLDNFLGSAGDAGSLIEAIGQGVVLRKQPRPLARPVPGMPKQDLTQPVRLRLDEVGKVGLQDFDSPCLHAWDALLFSARDLLQSARTSPSPRSGHEAQKPRGGAGAQEAREDGAEAITAACRHEGAAGGSIGSTVACEAVAPVAAAAAASAGMPVTSPAPAPELATVPDALGEDLRTAEARRDLLAKLAEMDDHEAMRGFMRHFLIGVRRRILRNLPGSDALSDAGGSGAEGGGAAEDEEGASTEDFDDDDSDWSCKSVNTVTIED
uniref:Uncharacterized protein n=1 Tax=Pyrodinium bahamense TaxID=73915 RepID=A0A7S0FAM2_9DINO|mmetsp:Transcript_17230/g.47533  ORF Transcript_17230/g.47533 Transcript_17230/m.47533 type:complete len:379 (+) Transcript_17230:111-1247(+)